MEIFEGTAHNILHDDLAFLRSVVVWFPLDKSRAYRATRTVENICQFSWEQLPYPTYNPDFAPADF